MTQIEQIRDEIERRMYENQQDYSEEGAGAFYEDRQLLSFINSLLTEQSKLKVRYARKIYDVIRIKELPCGITMYGVEDEPNHIDYINKDSCEIISEQQPSEDLVDAASRYAKEEYSHKSPATLPDRCIGCYAPLMYAFKDGANWQKEQTINKACKWLNENVVEYHPRTGKLRPIVNINAFREAMEDEQ